MVTQPLVSLQPCDNHTISCFIKSRHKMVEDIFVYCDMHSQLYKYQQKKLYVSPYDSTA